MEEKCTIGTETDFNFQNSLKHRIIIAQYIEELDKVFIGKNVVKRIISPSADLYEHIQRIRQNFQLSIQQIFSRNNGKISN